MFFYIFFLNLLFICQPPPRKKSERSTKEVRNTGFGVTPNISRSSEYCNKHPPPLAGGLWPLVNSMESGVCLQLKGIPPCRMRRGIKVIQRPTEGHQFWGTQNSHFFLLFFSTFFFS